jgi:hypothetical protein
METKLVMSGRPQKNFREYLIELSNVHVVNNDYFTGLAIAFLECAIEAKYAEDSANSF